MGHELYMDRGGARLEELASFHPTIVAWFAKLARNDDRRWLGMACYYVVLCNAADGDSPIGSHGTLEATLRKGVEHYAMLMETLAHLNGMLPKEDEISIPDLETFFRLLTSFNSDLGVSDLLASGELIWCERGDPGRLRRTLWKYGIREPSLSAIVDSHYFVGR